MIIDLAVFFLSSYDVFLLHTPRLDSFCYTPRLDEDAIAREALLVAEKQENEVTKKTLIEALDQIEELVKEVECANNSMHQLQDSIQRFVYSKTSVIRETCLCVPWFSPFCIHERRLEQSASAREAVLLTEREEKDATSKALAEAEARIEGLLEEISSANRNTDLLKKTIERYVFVMKGFFLCKLYYQGITCIRCIDLHLQTSCCISF